MEREAEKTSQLSEKSVATAYFCLLLAHLSPVSRYNGLLLEIAVASTEGTVSVVRNVHYSGA